MKAALTRRDTLVLGAGAVAAFTSPLALAQQEPERHGISAFGDLKYPADFKHFDYVNPDAPKGGLFSQVGRPSNTTRISSPSILSTRTS